MRFIEGKANVVADTLSRVKTPASAVSAPPTVLDIFVTTLGSGVDFTAMAKDQKTDIEMHLDPDLETSSAELVYGAPLTIPGEYLAQSEDQSVTHQLTKLRNFV